MSCVSEPLARARVLPDEGAQALVLLGAGPAAVEVGAHAGHRCVRVGVAVAPYSFL